MGELEDLLKLIKECWPELVISKEDLLRPTQEVVCRFYSKLVEDYNEKIANLTGVSTTFEFKAANCEPEEQLFLQVSRLLRGICGPKFALADIYQPTAFRTKQFFNLCIHFVAFIEYLHPDAETLANTVLKIKEDSAKFLLEKQELIDEINEKAKKKAELSENKTQLEQELKCTTTAYKEMKVLRASKEKLFAKKRNQEEKFKCELENEEYELKRLEKIEKDLSEQRVTEEEHQNILHIIETLNTELKMLDNDDVGIEDGLVHEHKVLRHCSGCIQILDKFNVNVENIKNLIHKEEELKAVSNAVDKFTSALHFAKQQKFESEQKLAILKDKLVNLESEYNIIKDNYTTIKSLYSQELKEIKYSLQKKLDNNCQIILDHNGDIEKLEADLDKAKNTFTTEYIKVSKVEKAVIDRFQDMLMKFKEVLS